MDEYTNSRETLNAGLAHIFCAHRAYEADGQWVIKSHRVDSLVDALAQWVGRQFPGATVRLDRIHKSLACLHIDCALMARSESIRIDP